MPKPDNDHIVVTWKIEGGHLVCTRTVNTVSRLRYYVDHSKEIARLAILGNPYAVAVQNEGANLIKDPSPARACLFAEKVDQYILVLLN